jgi:hypothetical protein
MRAAVLLVCCSVLSGCAAKKERPDPFSQPASAKQKSGQIITLGGSLPGRVVSVNTNGRFAVLRFPLGEMPRVQDRMNVYRDGLKVGEIRISGPQRDTHTVADVMAGECRIGDEVRAH